MECRQEFLPLLNRFHPYWEVFERVDILQTKKDSGDHDQLDNVL